MVGISPVPTWCSLMNVTSSSTVSRALVSLVSSFPILLRSSSLIPSLAADAQEATRPADGQSGNAFLREDLPGRFFTDTP